MANDTNQVAPSQKKIRQIGIRWSDERKLAWWNLAEREKRKPSDLARLVLEEYMTSFIPRPDADALGLAPEWRAAGLLELAMDKRAHRHDGKTK